MLSGENLAPIILSFFSFPASFSLYWDWLICKQTEWKENPNRGHFAIIFLATRLPPNNQKGHHAEEISNAESVRLTFKLPRLWWKSSEAFFVLDFLLDPVIASRNYHIHYYFHFAAQRQLFPAAKSLHATSLYLSRIKEILCPLLLRLWRWFMWQDL